MNKLVACIMIVAQVGLFSCKQMKLDNTFYCFNNCVRTLPNSPETMKAQAEMVKAIGYDGFAGHVSRNNLELMKAIDEVGLKMPEVYWGMFLNDNGEINYKDGLKEVIEASGDNKMIVSLFLISDKYKENMEEGDKLFAQGISELADFAASHNVKIAIYPHVNFYCEESAHSVKLAKAVERENVGVAFNLCHFLKVEGEENLKKQALNTLPYLFMVSINGADSGNTRTMGWDRLIQPLGEGSFDTYQLVKVLKDNGYEGPFGLQCYNIDQDCELALTKSMNTWQKYMLSYAGLYNK